MNALEWYNKLARHCEDTPALGSIQYKQIELLAEFVAKVEAAQQMFAPDPPSACPDCGSVDEHIHYANCPLAKTAGR